MIINKSAFERGFGHGTVYTAETIDLDDAGEEGEWFYFSNPETPKGQRTCPTLDPHGLPYIGQRIERERWEPRWHAPGPPPQTSLRRRQPIPEYRPCASRELRISVGFDEPAPEPAPECAAGLLGCAQMVVRACTYPSNP